MIHNRPADRTGDARDASAFRSPFEAPDSAGSGTHVPFAEEWTARSVPERFEAQVEAHDDRPAIWFADRCLTYVELQRLAEEVARIAVAECGTAGRTIATLLEHEAPVPAAILGILKAGHCYVPLDPAHPRERSEFVLDDAQCELIVTNDRNQALAQTLAGTRRKLVNLDHLAPAPRTAPVRPAPVPDAPAYLLYTSGSTGTPKGVVHTHRSLLHLVMRHSNAHRIGAEDRIALLFAYNFSASVSNALGALLNGAAVVPYDLRERGTARLETWLRQREITVLHTAPTVFRQFTDGMKGLGSFERLRIVRLGGEPMFRKDIERFRRCFGARCKLYVGMGSSETGMVLECFLDRDSECRTERLPLGFPAQGTDVLIVDEHGNELGKGQTGEIAVRSRFLSPGYWRRPDLTAAAFRTNPHDPGQRLYLTGDLGFELPSGCFFHAGRKDSQIKIRGARVEPAEVEAALLRFRDVREAIVLAVTGRRGEARLFAYVTPERGAAALDTAAIREHARACLPEHMVPSLFLVLDDFPRLPSGKVDRQALPQHDPAVPLPDDYSETARLTMLETQLRAVWQELLHMDGVGVRDDFFELGGDSLLAADLIVRIEELFDRRLRFEDFPDRLTIEALSRILLERSGEIFQAPVVVLQPNGSKPPLFFFHGDFETGGLYCRNLARHLDADRPFFAVHPHGLDGGAIPDTIEAMAADSLARILAMRPSGPYLLGGHCNGGIVAFEVARQMACQGRDVGALLIVDAPARNADFKLAAALTRTLARVLRLSTNARRACFRRLRMHAAGWRNAARSGIGARARFLCRKLINLATHAPSVLRRRSESIADPAGVAPSFPESTTEPRVPFDRELIRLALHEAVEEYMPRKYPGRIVLFGSTTHWSRFPDDPAAGWRSVVAQVDLRRLRGTHRTCVSRDADDLARQFREYLDG